MANNVSIIEIDASIERVWETITRPELVKQWQYGSDLITTWEKGTDIRFRTEWDGKVFEQWGKVLEVIAPHFIKYSLFAPAPGREDKPENYFNMIYKLSGSDGKVELEITQEDNRPGATQAETKGEENPVLQGLKKVAEKNN